MIAYFYVEFVAEVVDSLLFGADPFGAHFAGEVEFGVDSSGVYSSANSVSGF